MNDIKTLQAIANRNRQSYRQKLVIGAEKLNNQDSFSAKFTGYDVTSGRYICETENGDRFYSQSITNGGISLGGKVNLQKSLGFPSVDQMPS